MEYDLSSSGVSQAYTIHADHVRLAVRLTPNAGRNHIEGLETTADGDRFLKARVSAVPEDGKANKALIALLSATLKVPKSSISFLSGETSRKKILRIDGDAEDLRTRLETLLRA